MTTDTDNFNFENSLKRLESIATSLEAGDLSLDDSLRMFEEGVLLSRLCEKKLYTVEEKIQIIENAEIKELEKMIAESEASTTTKENNKKSTKKTSVKQKDISNEDGGNFLFD